MSLQAILTNAALPPLLLVAASLAGGLLGLLGWRRLGGATAALSAAAVLALSTPMAEGWLRFPLERDAMARGGPPGEAPRAIIVLGGESARGVAGLEVGPLTLERLRAGAALHRRTGLPLLVTAGPLSAGDPPLAALMARSLTQDFGVPVRWVEDRAGDTRENAAFGVALLRAEGIGSAYVVTHAWHLLRAREAFSRLGFDTVPAPVRVELPPRGRVLSDWLPRPDHLAGSWFAIREWVGRLVYAIRCDGTLVSGNPG